MTKSYPTHFDTDILRSIISALDTAKKAGVLTPRLTIDQLKAVLSTEQRKVVHQILELNPSDYDVHTPYIGLEPVPGDLVTVTGQQYMEKGEPKTLSDKLVPRHVHDAFMLMNDAFEREQPSRRLLIESAYRSPAYQITVFINWCLDAYDGDIATTIRHASPPAYSQHTLAGKTALDLKNIDGLPDNKQPERFKTTLEYHWLKQRADSFGFHESWPADNIYGMRAEPWHWQYIGKTPKQAK